MTRSHHACLRGLAAVMFLYVLAGCAPEPVVRDAAWSRYVAAETAYRHCRLDTRLAPPPCEAERSAYKAAHERYLLDTGTMPPPGTR